jgi:hypothetical protein
MAIPEELDGARVVKYAAVSSHVKPTGATRHVFAGAEMEPAAALAIARYASENGFYLFYLDHAGNVVTDTFHDSVESALEQAAFEYGGLSWIEPD